MGYCNKECSGNPNNPKSHLICDECSKFLEPAATKNSRYLHGSFNDTVRKMIERAKSRNRHEVTISNKDIYNIWPEDNKCPIMKTTFRRGEPRTNSPSLDRIDSSKGYESGNIQIICTLANKMKQNATQQELERFCEYYGKSNSNNSA